MKKSILFLFIYVGLANINFAQDITSSNNPLKHSLGLGLNLSTNGIGIQLAHSILKNGKLVARLEGRYYFIDINNQETYINQIKMQVNGFIKRGSIGVLLDYHPFKNPFKISAGFSILLNEVSNLVKRKDSLQVGNIMISPDEMGSISLNYNVQPSPYFGVGYGNAIPKKRIGITAEIGFYYTNIPKINYKTNGMLEPVNLSNVTANGVFFGDYYNFPFLPVYNLGLNIRLGKINRKMNLD
ncbi:MAG: hypothetical protein NTU43_11910 [Bacteroidetes bacterium]|nr:hypothetical protein [Bacteroidota bacterium]